MNISPVPDSSGIQKANANEQSERQADEAVANKTPAEAAPALQIESSEPDPSQLQPGQDTQPTKRSPAEAFVELSNSIGLLQKKLEDVYGLVRELREQRWEGAEPVIESLIRLHDAIFRKITAMEAGDSPLDENLIEFLRMLEAELRNHQIEVLRPITGEQLDLKVMNTVGAVKCHFWRKPDRVAQTRCCAFFLNTEAEQRVLRKAQVTVFRRQS